MEFEAIVAPTIKEMFVRRIEDMILNGELEIGSKLPSERELAEQMKISKTAVHGGITDMVRKGFLEVKPRKGVFVGDYARNGTLETLTSITTHNGGRLDLKNTRSLLEMRYAIESVAIKKVGDKKGGKIGKELMAMVAMAKKIAKEPTDYRALGELYFRFHHSICIESGNTIAPLIFNAFRIPSIAFWSNSAKALGPEESVRRLEKFANYICNGDTDKALEHLKIITETSAEIVREAGLK